MIKKFAPALLLRVSSRSDFDLCCRECRRAVRCDLRDEHGLVGDEGGGARAADDLVATGGHQLLGSVALDEPGPRLVAVRHRHVEVALQSVLQRRHLGNVAVGGDPHVDRRIGLGKPPQRGVRMHRDRVHVTEAPVEVGDPDHHLCDVPTHPRAFMAPIHESTDVAAVLVVLPGRDQLDLTDGQGRVTNDQRLVEERGGGNDAAVLLDDRRAVDAVSVALDDHLQVARVFRDPAVGDQRVQVFEVVALRGPEDRAVGKGAAHPAMLRSAPRDSERSRGAAGESRVP